MLYHTIKELSNFQIISILPMYIIYIKLPNTNDLTIVT